MLNLSAINEGGDLVTRDYVDSMVDYDFTVTLAASSWSNNSITVSNANFIASGYSYYVAPNSPNFDDWCAARIYAADVTTNGQMTFSCTTTPTSNIVVNISRRVAITS